MCIAFTPDCGYDNSTFILIGDVSCPNTNCAGRLSLQKKTFQSLGRSDYQCPQCASVYQVRNILLKIKQILFSCHLANRFTFLERVQNQFKMLLEILNWQVLFQQREMRISWQLCNNSEIFFSGWEPSCLFTKFLLCYKST